MIRSGFLPAGFLAVDTRPLITLAACGAGNTIHFPIIAIKGKHIIHTIRITTIQVVPGIPTAITIGIHIISTGIHMPTGIHTIITVITDEKGKPCWTKIALAS
jgi:hypothetical protein